MSHKKRKKKQKKKNHPDWLSQTRLEGVLTSIFLSWHNAVLRILIGHKKQFTFSLGKPNVKKAKKKKKIPQKWLVSVKYPPGVTWTAVGPLAALRESHHHSLHLLMWKMANNLSKLDLWCSQKIVSFLPKVYQNICQLRLLTFLLWLSLCCICICTATMV